MGVWEATSDERKNVLNGERKWRRETRLCINLLLSFLAFLW